MRIHSAHDFMLKGQGCTPLEHKESVRQYASAHLVTCTSTNPAFAPSWARDSAQAPTPILLLPNNNPFKPLISFLTLSHSSLLSPSPSPSHPSLYTPPPIFPPSARRLSSSVPKPYPVPQPARPGRGFHSCRCRAEVYDSMVDKREVRVVEVLLLVEARFRRDTSKGERSGRRGTVDADSEEEEVDEWAEDDNSRIIAFESCLFSVRRATAFSSPSLIAPSDPISPSCSVEAPNIPFALISFSPCNKPFTRSTCWSTKARRAEKLACNSGSSRADQTKEMKAPEPRTIERIVDRRRRYGIRVEGWRGAEERWDIGGGCVGV